MDFIRKRRGVERINLLAWSWGTRIMGWYTAQNNEKVEKLILYAPGWIRAAGVSLTDQGGKLGAYRTVSRDMTKGRWLSGVAEHKKGDLIPPGWFEAWIHATFATDPEGMSAVRGRETERSCRGARRHSCLGRRWRRKRDCRCGSSEP